MDDIELTATRVRLATESTVHDLEDMKFDAGTGWTYQSCCGRILFGRRAMRTTRDVTCRECLRIGLHPTRRI